MIELHQKISFALGTPWNGRMKGFTIKAVKTEDPKDGIGGDGETIWADTDEEAQAFGVYATMTDNTSQWVADLDSREEAEQFIQVLDYIGNNFRQSHAEMEGFICDITKFGDIEAGDLSPYTIDFIRQHQRSYADMDTEDDVAQEHIYSISILEADNNVLINWKTLEKKCYTIVWDDLQKIKNHCEEYDLAYFRIINP